MSQNPEKPKFLNEHGLTVWDEYICDIKKNNEQALKILHDLCYWEQLKMEAQEQLEENEMLVCVYYNTDGSIKHTQASAFFTVLKDAQVKVNDLRDKIEPYYKKEEVKSPTKLKSVKNF